MHVRPAVLDDAPAIAAIYNAASAAKPAANLVTWQESVEDREQWLAQMDKDDYPVYVLRWLRWRRRGTVILPDQPWNRGFEHPQVYRYAGDRGEMAGVLERVVAETRAAESPPG